MLAADGMPIHAGTKVVGCTGRGIFGVLPNGTPVEIDPSSTRQAGISLLLGRVPGARFHAFAGKRPEGARHCTPRVALHAGCEPLGGVQWDLREVQITRHQVCGMRLSVHIASLP